MQRRRLRRWVIVTAFAVAGLVASLLIATPARAAFGCDYGGNLETAYGTLTNGFLYVDKCNYASPRNLSQINVYYTKNSGPTIYARFAWDWTNANGVPYGTRQWDQGIFVQTSGTKYFKWRYVYPGWAPSGPRCVHGVMVTYTSSGVPIATYVTKTICW